MSTIRPIPTNVNRLDITQTLGEKTFIIDVCENCLDEFFKSLDGRYGYTIRFTNRFGTCEICHMDTFDKRNWKMKHKSKRKG